MSVWKRRLKELAAFKKKFGNCWVSTLDEKHRSLGYWVRTQRSRKKKGKLTEEQIRLLNELDFSWSFPKSTLRSTRKHKAKRMNQAELERLNRARWESWYKALLAYRRAHGDCRVPISPKERADLGSWVSSQRHLRREGKLSKDRLRRLDKVGFVWDLWIDKWEQMYAALVEYKKVHGTCMVPSSKNPQLHNWVATQRSYHRRRLLSPERRQRLTAIGFQW